jgi:hypothetical protein
MGGLDFFFGDWSLVGAGFAFRFAWTGAGAGGGIGWPERFRFRVRLRVVGRGWIVNDYTISFHGVE